MCSCLGHQGWIKIITTAPLCPPSLYQMSRHMTQTSQAFPLCLHTGIDQILEVAKTLQTHSCLPHNTLHSNSNLLSLLQLWLHTTALHGAQEGQAWTTPPERVWQRKMGGFTCRVMYALDHTVLSSFAQIDLRAEFLAQSSTKGVFNLDNWF